MTQATGIFLTGGPTAALPTQQRQRRGVLAPVIGLVALGICGLIVLGLVGTSVGVGGVVVGALCALLPVGPWWRRSSGSTAGSPSRRACCSSRSCGAPASPRSPR